MARTLLIDPGEARTRLAGRFRRHHRAWFEGGGKWPMSLPLGVPTEEQARRRFDDVRSWVEAWRRWSGAGDTHWIERRWPRLGVQALPGQLRLETPADVARLIGEEHRWRRACERRAEMLRRWPDLAGNLSNHFDALADQGEHDFDRLLHILEWLAEHPDSGLYARQLPVPGVDSKWIETRASLVTRLLREIRGEPEGSDFHTVTGLRREPATIRFRLLDENLRRHFGGLGDISAPVDEVTGLSLPVRRVFIVENLRTGLAFGDIPGSIVIMSLGYGVDVLDGIAWLDNLPCCYWGDIDTHGFAILSRLRGYLPAARSVLMDEATIVRHIDLCGSEQRPGTAARLEGLTPAEHEVYRGLLQGHWGPRMRLEQERIDWPYAWERIRAMVADERP